MVLSMEQWLGKTAIVTGASSGIGAAIAKALVENGVNVVGVARRVEKVQELARGLSSENAKLYPFKADISIEDEIKNIFKWTLDNIGPVHILINNAGVHYRTSLIDCESEPWRKTVDTNFLGVVIASREAIKIMRDHNIAGHIVNITSIFAHYVQNIMNLDVYPATKYAISAYTECLRYELVNAGSRIRLTTISPGAVDTEIFDERFRKSESFDHFKDTILDPEDIADGVIYALSTPPHVQVRELTIKPVGEKC